MADALPPDRHKSAGKKKGRKSGKVADFRYKRPFQPKGSSADEGPSSKPCAKGRSRSQVKGSRSKLDEKPGERRSNGQRANQRKSDSPRTQPQRAPQRFHGSRPGEAYAALDLGTNNCRLLIARPSGKDFTVIDAFSRVVKLGEDLATSGRLSDEAMDRALGAL